MVRLCTGDVCTRHEITIDEVLQNVIVPGGRAYDRLLLCTTSDVLACLLQACDPLYCDYTVIKSTWARITEFLSLVGGLWTTFLGIGEKSSFLGCVMVAFVSRDAYGCHIAIICDGCAGLALWFAIDHVIPSG